MIVSKYKIDPTYFNFSTIQSKLGDLCTKIINQKELKKSVIDPLVLYFKERLAYFYIAILVMLIVLLILNIGIVFLIFKYGIEIVSKLKGSV